ncbi:pentatricopeptide repeat-containing protein At2g18520, mitochondrial-like [Typha latifolia]|uniref:pentatricopeptide repeat-containing protein At2g18520, mitochondrial-like n=1 Tax=Typha latifolia TaxID=4733 RepID=UPI003C2F3016
MAVSSSSLLLRRHLSTSSLPRLPVEPSTVRRLARLRRFADIESLLEPLVKTSSSSSSSEPFLSSIISSYSSAGMLDHAVRHLSSLRSPSSLSLNSLLSPLLRSPHLSRRIPSLFSDLTARKSQPISPNHVSYAILIKSLCLSPGGADSALPILKKMEQNNLPITAVVYTTILDSFYKENRPTEAQKIWQEMTAKGIAPDLPAYNVRVMYYAMHKTPEEILNLIAEIESNNLKPDTITYNYLMSCYCRNGMFEEAMRVYKGLEEKGCVGNYATYRHLLAALCKNGDFDKGLEVFNDGVKQGKVPDYGTVKLLVEGLVKESKVRAAKRVVSGLKKKFPEEFIGNWKKLEKVVGLSADVKGSEQVTVA